MNLPREIRYIQKQVVNNQNRQLKLKQRLNALLKGKTVRIDCPNYTGQVSGNSKPKLQGKIFTIDNVDTVKEGKIVLFFKEYSGGIDSSLVTFVAEGKEEANGQD